MSQLHCVRQLRTFLNAPEVVGQSMHWLQTPARQAPASVRQTSTWTMRRPLRLSRSTTPHGLLVARTQVVPSRLCSQRCDIAPLLVGQHRVLQRGPCGSTRYGLVVAHAVASAPQWCLHTHRESRTRVRPGTSAQPLSYPWDPVSLPLVPEHPTFGTSGLSPSAADK